MGQTFSAVIGQSKIYENHGPMIHPIRQTLTQHKHTEGITESNQYRALRYMHLKPLRFWGLIDRLINVQLFKWKIQRFSEVTEFELTGQEE